MKLNFLLILLFLPYPLFTVSYGPILKSVELYAEHSSAFPLDQQNYIENDSISIKNRIGTKINSRNFSILSAVTMPSTKFSRLAQMEANEHLDNLDFVWGTKLYLNSNLFNLQILAGNLKFSRSVSRLKNPVISFPSPLVSSSVFQAGFSPSLPSFSSTQTPLSFSFIISPPTNLGFLPQLQFASSEDDQQMFCLFKNFSIQKTISICLSSTGIFYSAQQEGISSWFWSKPFFPQQKLFSMEHNATLSCRFLKVGGIFGMSENPQGGMNPWTRFQIFILLDNFTAGFFYYRGDRKLVTMNLSHPETKEQMIFNAQCKFIIGRQSISIGTSAGVNFKETNEIVPDRNREYNLKAALLFSSRLFSIETKGALSYRTNDRFYEYSTGVKVSVPYKYLSQAISLNYKNENVIKDTYSASMDLKFKKSIVSKATVSCTLKKEEDQMSFNCSGGMEFKANAKKINFRAKVSAAISKAK